MTASDFSARDRRALIIGATTVLLVIAMARGAPALLKRYVAVRDGAALASQRAARAEWAVRNASRTRATLRQVRAELAGYDSALVQGNTPDDAAAALMQIVNEAAAVADARIGSVQLSADTVGTRTALSRVSARVSVGGDLMAVAILLQTLEAGPQLLAVRELHVSQSPSASRRQVEVLQADLLVEGLYRRTPSAETR